MKWLAQQIDFELLRAFTFYLKSSPCGNSQRFKGKSVLMSTPLCAISVTTISVQATWKSFFIIFFPSATSGHATQKACGWQRDILDAEDANWKFHEYKFKLKNNSERSESSNWRKKYFREFVFRNHDVCKFVISWNFDEASCGEKYFACNF